jgi:hypothetical protein
MGAAFWVIKIEQVRARKINYAAPNLTDRIVGASSPVIY